MFLCHQAVYLGTGRRTVTFFSWKGDYSPVEINGRLLPGDDLRSHLLADCLYTEISSGPNAR